MKQGRSLPEVLTELQRQNSAKQDYIGAAEAFRLDDDGSTFHSVGGTYMKRTSLIKVTSI